MNIVKSGHVYELNHLDGDGNTQITFVCREIGDCHEGVTNQEVLRALIDRVHYLDAQLHWAGNTQIIEHLRMALVLHEARVLERKTECGKISPELIATDLDGHFVLTEVPKKEGAA